jgi:hypothetical protein
VTRALRHQDGSIPLVLTVAILVGGVVAAMFATIIGTQRVVRFDRSHSEAITSADAGLQQAVTYLSQLSGSEPNGTVVLSSELPPAAGNVLGNGSFTWVASKVAPLQWNVRSTGVVAGEKRVVEGSVAASSDFVLAAFADQGIAFQGGNGATSYPSTGLGSIGSNNAITMHGSSYADVVYLYGPSASCGGNGCGSGSVDGIQAQLDMDAIRANVLQKHDDLCVGFASWTASDYDYDNDGVVHLTPGAIICASEVEFDVDVLVLGPDQYNPVQMLVTGDITASNHQDVNCSDCDASSQPAAGALQIYSLGATFSVGNQSHLAAAVLAPNAGCAGSNSNAQTHLFGSIICRSMGNQGGWVFHYDVQLLQLGSGKLDIASYREETSATTSFTTP